LLPGCAPDGHRPTFGHAGTEQVLDAAPLPGVIDDDALIRLNRVAQDPELNEVSVVVVERLHALFADNLFTIKPHAHLTHALVFAPVNVHRKIVPSVGL